MESSMAVHLALHLVVCWVALTVEMRVALMGS